MLKTASIFTPAIFIPELSILFPRYKKIRQAKNVKNLSSQVWNDFGFAWMLFTSTG
jgi:hypothetical protein